jgi:TetR/AcrR family transcriptional regulator, transcriptional repressor for nem operon
VSSARERLIEVAIRLFWRYGYAGVSVDQLCEEAQVKKGSFYHFFASKEDLALAAIDAHWADRKPRLDALFSPSLAAIERFERYFAYIVRRQHELFDEQGHVLGCLYFSLGTENIDHPRLSAKIREILSVYERYYQSALVEAEEAGQIVVENPRLKAKVLFRFIEGHLADARLHNSLEGLREMPEQAWELLGVPALARQAGRPRRLAGS